MVFILHWSKRLKFRIVTGINYCMNLTEITSRFQKEKVINLYLLRLLHFRDGV